MIPAVDADSGTLADVSKDVVVRLRATSEDLARWQAAATADQRTLSDWLRIAANAAAPLTPDKWKVVDRLASCPICLALIGKGQRHTDAECASVPPYKATRAAKPKRRKR